MTHSKLQRSVAELPHERTLRLIPLALLLGFTLTALLTGCASDADGTDGATAEAAQSDEEDVAIPVEVAAVQRGDIFAVYSATGSLEAERDAQVVAKVEGQIVEILVEEGDRVKAGDVLARLDGDQLRLELARARASLEKLEAEYARNQALHAKGLVTKEAYDTIAFDVRASRADAELSALRLSYTQIRAPIDGVVSERMVKVGNTITANTETFRVTDLEPLITELFVPEREFQKLAAGQMAQVRVDALGEEPFAGRIARIAPVIDPATATFKVTVETTDPQGRLSPGMFARIDVVYDVHEHALQVPRDALVEGVDDEAVFVVGDGDQAERRTVRTGLENGGHVEIVDGLEFGEEVIVVGQSSLRDGGRIHVVNRRAEPLSEALAGDTFQH
ncbi:MAG: efflux RND transporter periplasmic adaptor subunit [Pseudomonadota bacterium]